MRHQKYTRPRFRPVAGAVARPLLLVSLGALLTLAGCASDGTVINPFKQNETPAPTYTSEFSDIPIPGDLSENRGDTFITFAPSGLKCGVQRFSGRVEVVSLMNTMRKNMAANGWSLRSLLRAQDSVLVFEKPDRVASIQITDGMVFTDMRVFVSSRLSGDSGAVEINPYAPKPARASSSSGASSSGDQKLNQ